MNVRMSSSRGALAVPLALALGSAGIPAQVATADGSTAPIVRDSGYDSQTDVCARVAEWLGVPGHARATRTERKAGDSHRTGHTPDPRDLSASNWGALQRELVSGDPCLHNLARWYSGEDGAGLSTDALLSVLRSGRDGSRAWAAFGLGLARSPEAVEGLGRALADPQSAVRVNAAWALGRIGTAGATSPLVRTLGDPQPEVRRAAVIALSRPGDSVRVAALVRVLREDRDPEVRKAAAWTLARYRTPSAVEGLGSALRAEPETEVREMAAWSLGQIRLPAAAGPLGDAVGVDRSPIVRSTAAWALGQMALPQAPEALTRGLADPDARVRLAVAWALGEVGDPGAALALTDALRRERDPQVLRAISRAVVLAREAPADAVAEVLRSPDAEVRAAAVRALAKQPPVWTWPWPDPRPIP